MLHSWVYDDAYPQGRRMAMTAAEQASVDADICDELSAWVRTLEVPSQLAADTAHYLAEAARLLRLGPT